MANKRIETLERLIPKYKSSGKILPQKIECMEWELRALIAEETIKSNVELTNKAIAWLSKTAH